MKNLSALYLAFTLSMKILSALYLGFALTMFAKLSVTDWQFWAIIVPFWILNDTDITISKINKSNTKN